MSRPHFAYVFERFPSFTQTFCAREVQDLQRLGMRLQIFSIRDTREEEVRHFPEELMQAVTFLPPEKELIEEVQALKEANRLHPSMVVTLRHWGDKPDKNRVYEAAWIGQKLRDKGVRHVHSHFAGLGARTCWWIRQFYGCSFSFTGHANDLFCDPGSHVTLTHLMRDASAVVTVSEFTRRWLREHFPDSTRRVFRVYNGLDLAPISSATVQSVKTQPPLIASVGRLIEKKGFDDLVTACALLRDRGLDFHCEIAGDGPLRDALTAQIEAANLTDRVILSGAASQAQITDLLGRASIFALACVTEKDGGMDNLPTVLMEAMAAHLPCVSTRLAGVPEMVAHDLTGLLTDERKPGDFASALEALLKDPTRAEAMGNAGHTLARERFSREVTSRHLRRVLMGHGKLRRDWSLPRECLHQLFARFGRNFRAPRLSRSAAVDPG